jgi:FixJ family two-component response regulator
MSERSLVCLVDDDESVRESLPDFLNAFGFDVRPFSSAKAFLASDCLGQCDCLILDIAMPEMSGPDLQAELKRLGRESPIIFITAHINEKIRLQALDQGAVAYLYKPFSQAALLEALAAATQPS